MSRRQQAALAAIPLESSVALFATLANSMRLRLLVALSRFGPMSAGDLQGIAGGEQSAVSHQLAILRRRRLVAARRDGRQMIYRLLDDHVAHIVESALEHEDEPRRASRARRN